MVEFESHAATFDFVFYELLQLILDERRIQVFPNTLIPIRIYRLRITFVPRREHHNLVCPNLSDFSRYRSATKNQPSVQNQATSKILRRPPPGGTPQDELCFLSAG